MSDLIFCVRQLVISNLSWYHATRQTLGEAAGRERAININRPVLEQWYPEGIVSMERLPIQNSYFESNDNGSLLDVIVTDQRSINLQGGGKNWRLAGDAIPGSFYGTLRENDLLLMMFDVKLKELSWFCIRSGEGLDINGEPRNEEIVTPEERNLYKKILVWLGKPNADRSMWLPDFKTTLTILSNVYQLRKATWNLLKVDQIIAGHALDPITNYTKRKSLKTNRPHNRILYGAPGTGKSYRLNKQASEAVFGNNISRITFHADYSNSNFVGSYKPIAHYIEEDKKIYNNFHSQPSDISISNRRPVMDYRIVPGPFLNTLLKSLKYPEENHLLIIEEINRANASAVFGDIFQMLDRTIEGVSEYSLTFSVEISRWILDNNIVEDGFLASFITVSEMEKVVSVRIPSNMYIWATMNSADQGVMPLDSAFKRRWSFEYVPLDDGEGDADYNVSLLGRLLPWNLLRRSINDFFATSLRQRLKISEDKLIGPFFIKKNECLGEQKEKIVLDKLMLYLHQDLVRHDPQNIFKEKLYSQVYNGYVVEAELYKMQVETRENFVNALSSVFTNELSNKLCNDLFSHIIIE